MTDPLPAAQTEGVKSEPGPPATPTRTQLAPSFRALFLEHASYVASSLRRLGIRERDLEDLTHDVFLAVYRRFKDYDPQRPIKPWLFGFAVRIALGHKRRKSYSREVATADVEAAAAGMPGGSAPAADEEVAARQSRSLVLAALGAVSEERRPVFILHDIDGVPMPDIASSLGIPLNTGYSRLRLARSEFAAAVHRIRARSANHE